MAKKGNRIQVILECTEHKDSGLPGTSRYITTKNKKNTPDRLEIKKFNNYGKKSSSNTSNGFEKAHKSHQNDQKGWVQILYFF